MALVLILLPMQKVIFHLEAFVAKFMRIYERSDPSSQITNDWPTNYHLVTLWEWTSKTRDRNISPDE